MTINFKAISNPPPSMNWEEYEARTKREWEKLLNMGQGISEKEIQNFLETHPSMIPGAFGLAFTSGHYPFPGAVISQPILKGLGTKRPDFMWLAMDSGTFYPVLVEIEKPAKKWFTNSGVPSKDLTQARDQIASWKQWFSMPENNLMFRKMYQLDLLPELARKAIHPVYVLIYGRRKELQDRPMLSSKRDQLKTHDEYLMTFDRISPDSNARELMCASLVEKNGEFIYKAISVPPTIKLGTPLDKYRLIIRDREDAIERNDWITKARKEFLLQRLSYWDDYANKEGGLRATPMGVE